MSEPIQCPKCCDDIVLGVEMRGQTVCLACAWKDAGFVHDRLKESDALVNSLTEERDELRAAALAVCTAPPPVEDGGWAVKVDGKAFNELCATVTKMGIYVPQRLHVVDQKKEEAP